MIRKHFQPSFYPQADVLMFDEADFSAPYSLPGPMMDSQGNMFVPLLQGYTVGVSVNVEYVLV